MTLHTKFPVMLAAAFLSAFAGVISLRADGVEAYLSAPYTQLASDDGLTTGGGLAGVANQGFEGFSQGKFSTLTASPLTYTSLTGNSTINANGQYGGGGQGQYLGIATGDTVTLTFSTPVDYFGLLWCAVDASNSLQIFDQNNKIIGTFNASTFSTLLPRNSTSTVTAINHTMYNTISYYGQPTGDPSTTTTLSNRKDNSEQFAYLNFIASGSTKIGKITFSESGAVFETDNHALLTTPVSPLQDFVDLGPVPEPSALALMLAGVGIVAFTQRARWQRQ